MFWVLFVIQISLTQPEQLTFPSLNDPFRHQPQKCQQDESQDGGNQDVKSLVFHPGSWDMVEGSKEGRRERKEEEVSEGRRFKEAPLSRQLLGHG